MSLEHLLAEILRGTPRLPLALCRGDAYVFHLSADEADLEHRAMATSAALRLCQACPELTACRTWLDGEPASRRPPEVTAGRIGVGQ